MIFDIFPIGRTKKKSLKSLKSYSKIEKLNNAYMYPQEMKTNNKRPINIVLSPFILDKLRSMEHNALRIYGKHASRSQIIEKLIMDAGDRESQLQARIRAVQKELCDLGEELASVKEAKEQKPLINLFADVR